MEALKEWTSGDPKDTELMDVRHASARSSLEVGSHLD